MQRSIVMSTLRSTIRWTLVPAAVLYAISLVWSSAEGIDLQLVVRDLAQTCDALGPAIALDAHVSRPWQQLYITYTVFSLFGANEVDAAQNFLPFPPTMIQRIEQGFKLRRFGGDSFLLSVLLLGSSVLIDACKTICPLQRFNSLKRGSSCSLPLGWVFGVNTLLLPPALRSPERPAK